MGDDDRRAAVDDAAPLLDGVSSRAAPERRSIPVGRALSVVTCGIVAVVVVVLVTLVPGRRGSPPHCLVVVSLDGFRYDYLKHLPPDSALQRLAAEGVHVNRLRPVFPSKTFPNHYTLVTGVFPETHGCVLADSGLLPALSHVQNRREPFLRPNGFNMVYNGKYRK